jgi:PadR family transcriptional regulator PadR
MLCIVKSWPPGPAHLGICFGGSRLSPPLDKLDERSNTPSSLSRGGAPRDLVQGTLHMLILKTLALEPMHGYGIGVRLEQISRGVFQVNAGSLFPALRRLERDGLIAGEWRTTENNRRAKYYRLTASGRARLKQESRDWEAQSSAIARILKASPSEL